ncbi:hypothetical protein INT47_010873 [Mucor saturninus]|uniref:Tc1-like transposase DDE domain-containing protein n=1 Tax=Mucor saturninus TaxID=64648 RepID=A0A8H7RBH1_9FUNG|nr:hypothetical protein INT47_010873 [Mucor saturninus]
MDLRIYQEDGHGNAVDEHGNEPVEMEVDVDGYPLADTVDFDSYMEFKPPEKPEASIKANKMVSTAASGPVSYYKKHGDDVKGHFFYLVYEEGLTAGKAGKQLGIARRTAYDWLKKDQDLIVESRDGLETKKTEKKVGRPALLNEEHKKHLEETFIDHPSATLDQAIESLTNQFSELKVTKTTVYNFMTEKCALSFKKAHFHSKERNSPVSIEKRFDWITRWIQTDMDYNSNCVFIDESAFHINLKRTMAWSKKGTRAEVIQPLTRAKTTTILGAISPYGIVNVKIRVPYSAASKKRKTVGGSKMQKSIGTVTGHYFNFIASTIDVMDRHEEFKGHYIIMDNAPIHTSDNIRKFIESRGYGCVYLPPYSPELNPIEQFWSVVKSKLKREKLLEAENLNTRITEACQNVLISDLKGFCRYSESKFETCLNKNPL